MLRALLVAATAMSFALPASAQIAWEAPPLVSPTAPSGLSLFLLRAGGDRLGGLATYRHDAGSVGVGYRVAITEEREPEDFAIAGGLDVSGYLARGVEDAPVDVAWWSGLGLGHGNETVVTVPLGLVVGWSGSGDDVIFSPYAGGHVALDVSTADNDAMSFGGALDVGMDIVLESGWMVRFGASMGDAGREALVIGLKMPG